MDLKLEKISVMLGVLERSLVTLRSVKGPEVTQPPPVPGGSTRSRLKTLI